MSSLYTLSLKKSNALSLFVLEEWKEKGKIKKVLAFLKKCAIIIYVLISGCSAVLVARLNGVQEAAGSTPVTRTIKNPLGVA